MSLKLTARQKDVLEVLRGFAEARGRMPSVRELADELGLAAATVQQHLAALERKGHIERDGSAHGLSLLARARSASESPLHAIGDQRGALESFDLSRVPVLGTIAAGQPIEALEEREDALFLPRSLAPAGVFALKVQGTSMVDDHILDGDIVVVRPAATVDEGEIAVALLSDGSATLKRVFREGDRFRLQPANSEMAPLYVTELIIQGRVTGLVRRMQ